MRLTLINEVVVPAAGVANWRDISPDLLRALEIAYFSFARYMVPDDNPAWCLTISKLFQSLTNQFPLGEAYFARRGYYCGLKSCAAGLVMVSDMSVVCFLESGELLQILASCLGFRSIQNLMDAARQGLSRDMLSHMESTIKGMKCKLKHLRHAKKVKGLGPMPTHKDSEFDVNGTKMTVAKYYETTAKTNPVYKGMMI